LMLTRLVRPPSARCTTWCGSHAEAGWSHPPGCFCNPYRRRGAGITEDMLTADYDGCGRCLVEVRGLSCKTDKTSSSTRVRPDQILQPRSTSGAHRGVGQ
jgi:hypothetical protein